MRQFGKGNYPAPKIAGFRMLGWTCYSKLLERINYQNVGKEVLES